MQIAKVEETRLWMTLNGRHDAEAQSLASSVSALCGEAANRMKAMLIYAPQYTLHDELHLLRTTEIMGTLLGTTISQLNTIELALLVLSAFFHDQGMVPSEEEFSSLQSNPDFQLFKDKWLVEHPNYGETLARMNSTIYIPERKKQFAEQLAELNGAMLTEYLRMKHGQKSAEYVRLTYGVDKRIEVQNVNLAPYVARLCESHTLPCEALIRDKEFPYDEQIDIYSVNMPFLAAILRLADVLDFDRDRTPDVLLKSIHFTSPVSLSEWEKHRSVVGWTISPDIIRFTIKCKHPAYEAAAQNYMDWIDKELTGTQEVHLMQPQGIKDCWPDLPTHVDRSRIGPLDNAYRYHDLEFNLSRDEVVRLLMTDKLYGGEHLCIRELLQNSLDALRYRKALFAESGIHWNEGRVEFRHYVNADGYEVIECKDNGSGMDEEIIRNNFIKIGRSYYRSPEFESERTRLKRSGNDFDPCSKFGIGFMSCFMLGDRITIETRKDYGYGRELGNPLIIEIYGLSGLLVLHDGPSCQDVGTKVSIVCRQKPSFLDSWTDKVQLTRVLKGYALATEFPLIGRCEVEEILDTVNIPPIPEIPQTLLEKAQVKGSKYFKQDLSQVSNSLGGFVKESFLIDGAGIPCLANSEAEWCGVTEGAIKRWKLHILQTDCLRTFESREMYVPVCIDGILVAGCPGRASYREEAQHLGERSSFIDSYSPALVDARGELKPEITPGRIPPDVFGMDFPPGWKRLRDLFKQGVGLLWKQLAEYLQQGLAPKTFWQLAIIYDITVGWIPHGIFWSAVSVSLIKPEDQAGCWRLIRELGELSICPCDRGFILQDRNGANIGPDECLNTWEKQGPRSSIDFQMNSIVLLMSSLDVRDEKIVLVPQPPSNLNVPLWQYAQISPVGVSMFFINYAGAASDALTVETPYPTVNRNHPLAIISHNSRYNSVSNELQEFAKSFVSCIAESVSTKKQTPSLDKPGYWQKRVGHLYFSVQWDQYEPTLKPPYKIWTKDGGWYLFSEKDFAQWRDTPMQNER